MAMIDDVVAAFVRTKKLKPADTDPFSGWIHRQIMFFFRRRGGAINTAVPAWGAAANQPDLRLRLDNEFTALDTFLRGVVGKGATQGPLLPVLGGNAAGDKTPHHLDLADLARRRTSESAIDKVVKTRAKDMSWARLIKVHGIVWRAAALHPEIWTDVPAAGRTAATLKAGVLDEILDRRLHLLERMQYQVSTAGEEERDDDRLGAGGLGFRKRISAWGSGQRGPWKDGFRVRLFEYPRIAGNSASLEALVDPAALGYIASPGATTYLPHTPHDSTGDVNSTPASSHQHWQWHSDPTAPLPKTKRLEWRVLHGTAPPGANREWRFPLTLHDDYSALHVTPPQYHTIIVSPRGGSTGASVIDLLFDHTRPVTDVWERSWLWCDHVICVLHTEALLFGLRRRQGATTGEATFNNLVSGGTLPPGAIRPYVRIKPLVGTMDANHDPILETHDRSDHFESLLSSVDDLELGDHLIFWNHTLYTLLEGGDWRLENALIMSLDSDASTGNTIRSSIRMQGHGTSVRRYAGFQNTIAAQIEGRLQAAQVEVKGKVGGPGGSALSTIQLTRAKLVNWTPYSALTKVAFSKSNTVALEPWWVEIDPKGTDIPNPGTTAIDHAREVARVLPKTFAISTAPAAGYQPPPDQTKVYFPLFEPRVAVLRKTGNTLPGGKPETIKESGWSAYFLWHEARANLDKPPASMVKLMDLVQMSGELTPGLFLRVDKKIPVVRPKPLL